jgi:hypothetical protein
MSVHVFVNARLVRLAAFTMRSIIADGAQRPQVGRVERALRRNAQRLYVINASIPFAADISTAAHATMPVTQQDLLAKQSPPARSVEPRGLIHCAALCRDSDYFALRAHATGIG